MQIIVYLFFLSAPFIVFGQEKDSSVLVNGNYIRLSEIVVNKNLDVKEFIRIVENDTTFFKAFKNLRIVSYTAINDIRMLDKNNKIKASLNGKIHQIIHDNCRHMETQNEKITGDFYDKNGDYNYYTASMYAQLFFTKGIICHDNNIVGNREINTEGLTGIDKRKAQLKMLFFNPGRKITGIPFISNKTAIFDKNVAKNYDMEISYDDNSGTPAYIFSIKVKDGHESNVVIREMTTWFDIRNFEVLAKQYALSYNAGVYDFDIKMGVRMTHYKDLLVPSVITYNGGWKVIFKKRETGVFTATLSNFGE